MLQVLASVRAAQRFGDYKPQPLKCGSAARWAAQFRKEERRLLLKLLDRVIYLSEDRTRRILVEQNAALMRRLAGAGVPPDKLIYVQVHDAGSSSPVMLNLLRDAANLEKLGCWFVDARNVAGLNEAMNRAGSGALIYVDDFVGTGEQFCSERDFAARNFVLTTFSEFLLAPCVCEEACYELGKRGIEAFTGHVHSKAERPLHANSSLLKKPDKELLERACRRVRRKFSLGYKDLATMVVLYRNAPNTAPALLRGSPDQDPFRGIFPRAKDLPAPPPA